jgi:hypothetical protein
MAIVKPMPQKERLIMRFAFLIANRQNCGFEAIPRRIFREAEEKVNEYIAGGWFTKYRKERK